MNGSGQVRFSELFADTVSAHGTEWAYVYYCKQQGMPTWEWQFWLDRLPENAEIEPGCRLAH